MLHPLHSFMVTLVERKKSTTPGRLLDGGQSDRAHLYVIFEYQYYLSISLRSYLDQVKWKVYLYQAVR